MDTSLPIYKMPPTTVNAARKSASAVDGQWTVRHTMSVIVGWFRSFLCRWSTNLKSVTHISLSDGLCHDQWSKWAGMHSGAPKIGRDRSGAPNDSSSCRNAVFMAAGTHSAVQSGISMALLAPVTAAVAVNELILHASSHVQKMMIICLPFERLTLHDVASLVFIKSLLCCPPLHSWEHLKYVKSWLA